MRRIIRNRVYNTDAAKIVGHWDKHPGVYTETLYRKHTGEHFLDLDFLTEKYSMIEPVDYDRAVRWAVEHMSPDEYANVFEAPAAGRPVATCIEIDAQLLFEVKRAAAIAGISMKQWIEDAVKVRIIGNA